MKKIIPYILVVIVSVITTFFFFAAMSWYHFGDIPTPIVLIRLVFFCVVLICVLSAITYFIKKKR